MVKLALALFVGIRGFASVASAQITFVPRGDVERVQKAIADGVPNDAPVRMVSLNNRFQLGVYTLNSRPSAAPAPGTPIMGFYHNDIAEVYLVISGAGILRVGGMLENPKVDDPAQRPVKEIRGPGVTRVFMGIRIRKSPPGISSIVPPGVPHSPGEMFETTKIVRIVIDPHNVLPIFPPPAQPRSVTRPETPATPAPKLAGTFTYIPKATVDQALRERRRTLHTVELPAIRFRLSVATMHEPKASGLAELYYMLKGKGTVQSSGSQQQTESGDVIIAARGSRVGGKTNAAPRDMIRIAFDPDDRMPLK